MHGIAIEGQTKASNDKIAVACEFAGRILVANQSVRVDFRLLGVRTFFFFKLKLKTAATSVQGALLQVTPAYILQDAQTAQKKMHPSVHFLKCVKKGLFIVCTQL